MLYSARKVIQRTASFARGFKIAIGNLIYDTLLKRNNFEIGATKIREKRTS